MSRDYFCEAVAILDNESAMRPSKSHLRALHTEYASLVEKYEALANIMKGVLEEVQKRKLHEAVQHAVAVKGTGEGVQ